MCYKLVIGVNNTSSPCRVLCSNSLGYPYAYGLLPTGNYTITIWATLHLWGIMPKLYNEPCTYGLFLMGHYSRHLRVPLHLQATSYVALCWNPMGYPCAYRLFSTGYYVGTHLMLRGLCNFMEFQLK